MKLLPALQSSTLIFLASLVLALPTHAQSTSEPRSISRGAKRGVAADLKKLSDVEAKLPLEFEPNHGQAPAQYDFVAHGQSYALGISSTEIALNLFRPKQNSHATAVTSDLTSFAQSAPIEHAQVRLRLLGANTKSSVAGVDQRVGVSNYFIGDDPAKWHTDVPHFAKVERTSVYPGIGLIFYGNPEELEYDFRVAPNADTKAIRLQVSDAVSTALDRTGDLVIGTGGGAVRLKRPSAYQELDGVRRPVPSRFQMESKNTLRLEVGAYDHNKPLIIDPVLTYSAAFGGSNGNQALGMDLDSTGNVYITGNSCSVDFPTTAGNFENITTPSGIYACQDALLLKLNSSATSLIYSDYFGGTGASTGTHVAVDSSGNAFVTGATTSLNFPLKGNIGPSAPQYCSLLASPQHCPEGFVLKLSPDGSSMAFSTLLGGSQGTVGFQLKLNPVTGDVDVLGETNAPDFQPAFTGPQTLYDGGTCYNNTNCLSAYLLGLDPATGAMRYGTLLGGTGDNFAAGLDFDSSGNIYVAGTTSPPLSSTLGSVTHTYPPSGGVPAGAMDVFVTELKLSDNKLTPGYLTLVQGEGDDIPSGLAVDSTGNAYFTGSTASKNLPVTTGVFQSSTSSQNAECLWTFAFPHVTCGTIFVGKLDHTGALSFLTYLGGSTTDWGEAIALDSTGNIWLTGVTASSDFPFTKDGYGLMSFYTTDPFLAEMSSDGSKLTFASPVARLFGRATDLKIDRADNVYVAGYAGVAPSTPGTYTNNPTPILSQNNPLFVQKWGTGPAPAIALSAKKLNFDATSIGASAKPQTVMLSNTGSGPLELGIQTVATAISGVSNQFLESDNCGSLLAANSSCTLTFTFEPVSLSPECTPDNNCDPHSQSATVIIQTNAPTGTQTIALTGSSGMGPIVTVNPNPITFLPQIAGTASAAQNVLISNLGDINLVTSSVSVGGANAADFQIASSTCDAPVPPGSTAPSSCTVALVFNPDSSGTGSRNGTLNIVDNAVGSPQFISITGSIATPAAALNITPANVVIYDASIGAAPNDFGSIVVTNTSSAASVQVTGLTIGGPNAADFSFGPFISGSNIPATLAPGVSTNFGFLFNPTTGSAGPRQATVTLTTLPVIAGLPVVTLQSNAVTDNSPTLSFFSNPSPLDLGSVEVGQTTQGNTNFLQIDNAGPYPCASGAASCGAPLVISSIVSSLNDFALVPNTYSSSSFSYCTTPPLTIPVGQGCDFTATFAPTQAGTRSGTITINSNDPGGPQTLSVTGVGLALPIGNLSATGLNFGYSAIGIGSPPLTVTLQNTSAAILTVSNVAASTNYDVVSNTCSSVAPGASCVIGVSFFPLSAGASSGTLTITDNDALGAQQTVALSGIGATGASLMVRPSAVNFGTQTENTSSSIQPVTLTNFGDTPISFPAQAFRVSESFAVDSTTCQSALALQASCVVNLKFTPLAYATYSVSGTFSATDSARGNPQTIFLTGTGSNQTQTVLSSSANPSSTGQAITLTASVTGTGSSATVPAFYTLTGTVTFYDGAVSLGSMAVNGTTGTALLSTSSLSAGSHSITAVYGADSLYGSSTSATLVQFVGSTSQASSKTTLLSSLNPSTAGQAVTVSATVAGVTSNSPAPTGSVTFFDGGTMLASMPLSSNDQASTTTSALTAGSHSITAVYSSDSNYAGSTSPTLTQVVNAPAKVGTTTSVTSSLNPSTTGQSVTFSATVAGSTSSSGAPSGSVTFSDGGKMLGTGTLNNGGTASYMTAALAAGSHSITAVYGGDSNYTASTSSIVTQVVNTPAKMNSVTAIASSVNPSSAGQSITFMATVTAAVANTQVATGSVNFLDGMNMIGSGILDATGKASFSTSALTQGSHTITAQYAGDTTYLGSTSASLTEVITALPSFGLTINPTSLALNAGEIGNAAITVASNAGFNEAVNLSCFGLPAHATCAFSPSTLTPTANGSGTSTLTIKTNVNTANALNKDGRGHGDRAVLAIVSFGAFGFLWRRRKLFWIAKLNPLLLLAGILILGSAYILGCSGGSGNKTPSGTSSITISASSGSVQQTQTLTLTVR